MITIEDLKLRTSEFFQKHWGNEDDPPRWSERWLFKDTIPNQEKKGCYAMLSGEEIIYIGVGAGRGSGQYDQAGLGSRLHRYWRVKESNRSNPDGSTNYRPSTEWKEVTSIVTIGFAEFTYLAYSLEAFLIWSLNPPRNVKGKKAKL
jgi:hypothetical protein